MKIEKRLIKDLKPAEYNPRQSTQKQETKLRESLEKFGVVEPIIVNENEDRKNIIVGGHFRVRELKKLGYKEVDCVLVNLSVEDEKELNIRLNANTGEWDFNILANNFEIEEINEWGLEVPDMEIVKEDKEDKDLSDDLKSRYILEIECDSEAEQEILYNRFLGEKLKVKILSI